jgi:hypothetical protein
MVSSTTGQLFYLFTERDRDRTINGGHNIGHS